ncbi:MAG: glycosyltransferase family 4 protein [Acaryochloridaceae cyanobacterium SU_2_1]|nr:glycosyltransferase family 4 protein [Acaryochloridaceae cyanobacterium SU_2_1]
MIDCENGCLVDKPLGVAGQLSLRLLLVSTPLGPLGSGRGGGVELTLLNLWTALTEQGHQVQVIAPRHSQGPRPDIIEVEGCPPVPAQTQSRTSPILLPAHSLVAQMWEQVNGMQSEYDLIVNFAYDWLPFYLTPFLQRPIAHLVSMGSLTDAMDQIIGQVATRYPWTVGMHTQAQADTFTFAEHCYCVGNGFDLSIYDFADRSEPYLCWIGRIAAEKALEDAAAAAMRAGLPLKVMGHVADPAYLEKIQQTYPAGVIEYLGFLETSAMQGILRHSRGLLVTPRWVEAFGNVVIEALACGVPVIAYRRGGPAEILQDGKTGWLVEPDSIDGLTEAIQKLAQIDRRACREQAEQNYSLEVFGQRIEGWFQKILQVSASDL